MGGSKGRQRGKERNGGMEEGRGGGEKKEERERGRRGDERRNGKRGRGVRRIEECCVFSRNNIGPHYHACMDGWRGSHQKEN